MSLKSCFILSALALGVFACGNSESRETVAAASHDVSEISVEEPVEPEMAIEYDSCVFSDSLKLGDSESKAYVKIVYPITGEQRYIQAVENFIAYDLSGESDGSAVEHARSYVRSFLGDARDTYNELNESGDADFFLGYETSETIMPVFTSDKVVTYAAEQYLYTGGAHGGTVKHTKMFNPATGETYGYNILRKSKEAELINLVARALARQYFKLDNVSEFGDVLLIAPNEMTLPSNPPFIMADGVHFLYQEYDIAPYAAGLPECVIPFDKIEPYLSQVGKSLVP